MLLVARGGGAGVELVRRVTGSVAAATFSCRMLFNARAAIERYQALQAAAGEPAASGS